MTVASLAKRVGVSKSFLSLVERGQRQPGPETVVRLALELGIDPTEVVVASVREELPDDLKSCLSADRASADDVHALIRERHSREVDFEVGLSTMHYRVDWDGNAHISYAMEDCRPNVDCRPVRRITITQWTASGTAAEAGGDSHLLGITAPPDLDYVHVTERQDTRLQHKLDFPRGWRRGNNSREDALGLRYASTFLEAFEINPSRFLERARAEGIDHPVRGATNTHIKHFIHRLRVSLELPEGYEPDGLGYLVSLGRGIIDETTLDLRDRPCKSLSFVGDRNTACMEVLEPLIGYTFSIVWTPLEGRQAIEAMEKTR